MIEKPIETVLKKSNRDILIPADIVATVNENNNLQHVLLVLTKIKYSKIPVLDNDNHFKGLISLATVTENMLQDDGIQSEPLERILVKEVMQTEVPVVTDQEDLETIIRCLTNENFIPLVNQDQEFMGIITRREIFKQFNYLLHNFSEHYVALPLYKRVTKPTAK